jgi:hypothetical protein
MRPPHTSILACLAPPYQNKFPQARQATRLVCWHGAWQHFVLFYLQNKGRPHLAGISSEVESSAKAVALLEQLEVVQLVQRAIVVAPVDGHLQHG